jgi:hypothetical protein
MKIFALILALLILIVSLCLNLPPVVAHEGDYTHMNKTSGVIIFMTECGYHTTIGVDDTANRKIDRCLGTFVDHDMIHTIPVEFVIDNGELLCGCEVVDNG